MTEPEHRSEKYRCAGDRRLGTELLDNPHIQRVIQSLPTGPSQTRRRLLSTSLRVSPSMSPSLAQITEHCREVLGVTIPIETYVYSSPHFNAACVKPEDGRLFILLSSALLEAFKGAELTFVMGHELGHHIFGHHDIPIGWIMQGKSPPAPQLALQLFAWSRYAEISADRAGAACAHDRQAVAAALFRLASGLRSDIIEINGDALMRQADALQAETQNEEHRSQKDDWFATHPFSPLRLKALKHFFESKIMTQDGESIDALEAKVGAVLALMEPSYLDERTDGAEQMRRVLLSASFSVAQVDGEISTDEIQALTKMLGQAESVDPKAVAAELGPRIAGLPQSLSIARRAQLLRDVSIIAQADNHVSEAETQHLRQLGADLSLPPTIVETVLAKYDLLD